MSLRCKPRDLAICLEGCAIGTARPGDVVTVVELVPPGTEYTAGGRRFILGSSNVWKVLWRDGSRGIYLDSELLPIRAEPDPLEVTRDEAVPA